MAIGASHRRGARRFCAMKHVGLNVAADPLFTVLLHRGERRAWSSAWRTTRGCIPPRTSRIPATTPLRPSSRCWSPPIPPSAGTLSSAAYELSEQFDTPVLLRLTHPGLPLPEHRGDWESARSCRCKQYEKNPAKIRDDARLWPSRRHVVVEERTEGSAAMRGDNAASTASRWATARSRRHRLRHRLPVCQGGAGRYASAT